MLEEEDFLEEEEEALFDTEAAPLSVADTLRALPRLALSDAAALVARTSFRLSLALAAAVDADFMLI